MVSSMVSWTDAFLILKKWRDGDARGPTPLEYSDVISGEDLQGESISMAWGIRPVAISAVSVGSVTLFFKESQESREMELLGASFKYEDSRNSPFPDSSEDEYVCTLEITRSDGRVIVLAERSGEKGD